MNDPNSWLLSNGYHVTAGYASNYNAADYTNQNQSYTGVQGTCDAPKFRRQGSSFTAPYPTNNGTGYNMRLQYPEPNPEVLESYYGAFPYLGWADYVKWWHNTY